MNAKTIFLISPPFYSHFQPLHVLAKSFKQQGANVIFGCSSEFEKDIVEAGLTFFELNINKNRNTGKAEQTDQPDSESDRLDEFFEATRKGAVETLIVQSHHRKADMLHSPVELIEKLTEVKEQFNPDLFIVDILSYGVTLALLVIDAPFLTFCPPHPYTIPEEGAYYGLPKRWPDIIQVDQEKVKELKAVAKKTEEEFTEVFQQTLTEYGRPEVVIKNAFRAVSDQAILYNYLDFNQEEEKEASSLEKIYMGHSFEEASLSEEWKKKLKVDKKKILITLGTFLSNRVDVLEKLIQSCKLYDSEAQIIVSAGSNAEKLNAYRSENVLIESFVPQIALLPYMDAVIFHGGCNTFTETLYFGKPMILLPFSSDQFNIANDATGHHLATILDPNYFEQSDVANALEEKIGASNDSLAHWQNISKQRGPDYAAEKIMAMLTKRV